MPKISIVSNFYNSEKYIDKLIKSVLAQTFTDWELIAVNDCSPGRDSEILHRWAEKDSRIRVIDNPENLGIARAKKVGIDAANGEYVAFADGDDWFEKDALMRLHNAAIANDADIVFMEYYRVYPPCFKRRISLELDPSAYNRRIERKEFITDFYYIWLGYTPMFGPYWTKFFRASKLKAFDFEYSPKEETYIEDANFSRHILPTLDSFVFIPYAGYNWRYGGISSTVKPFEFHSVSRILDTYTKRYSDALKLIDTYNVGRARTTIKYEAVGALTDAIDRLVTPLIRTNAAKDVVTSAIQQQILDSELCGNQSIFEACPNNDIAVAILNKDAESIYNIMAKRYKLLWKTRLARRFFSLFT